MISDIENNLALDDNEFDDVKAYKIIKKYYDNSKSELEILNNRFDKCQNEINTKEKEFERLTGLNDNNDDIFTPSAIRVNYSEELELINHQILSLKNTSRNISDNILVCTEKIAEYSFIMSVLENSSSNVSLSNIDKISDIIDFCIKIIDVDRERVKEELFHVKHLLK